MAIKMGSVKANMKVEKTTPATFAAKIRKAPVEAIKVGWVHLVCSSRDTVMGTALVFDPATRVCIIVGVMGTAMLMIACMIAAATESTVAEATGIIGRGLAALATMALTTSATGWVFGGPRGHSEGQTL